MDRYDAKGTDGGGKEERINQTVDMTARVEGSGTAENLKTDDFANTHKYHIMNI